MRHPFAQSLALAMSVALGASVTGCTTQQARPASAVADPASTQAAAGAKARADYIRAHYDKLS